jgi:predicted nucleic acid-binding protein
MNRVFVDSLYWIARLHPKDEWHQKSKELETSLVGTRLFTTYEVIIEVLAFFAARGLYLRRTAAELITKILSNPNITVVPQTRELFEAAFRRYKERQDKEWSLTDCISILVMESNGMTSVLTHDHHFTQANFIILLQ